MSHTVICIVWLLSVRCYLWISIILIILITFYMLLYQCCVYDAGLMIHCYSGFYSDNVCDGEGKKGGGGEIERKLYVTEVFPSLR